MRPLTMLALAICIAAGALGCGSRDTSGRSRMWTLFELVEAARGQGRVGAGGDLPDGLPASFFVKPHLDAAGMATEDFELAVAQGFMDGLPMSYLATELWENVPEIWAQPLYRAIDAEGQVIDDPLEREPWVFGVGPHSLFYSPFWDVFGFQLPDGVAAGDVLDTRTVMEAAEATGGLRPLGRRITAIAPLDVEPPAVIGENSYYDDTAAWDGVGERRYIDFGSGRFDADSRAVVSAFPLFLMAQRNEAGLLQPVEGWPAVGGNRPVFGGAPSLVNVKGVGGAGGAGSEANPTSGGAPSAAVDLEPRFGGLWQLVLVEVPPTAGVIADGRVVANEACVQGAGRCLVLDSQDAVESLGAEHIKPTTFLLAGALLQLGQKGFYLSARPQPAPKP